MTLPRNCSEKSSRDELDNLIQWALRERVAGTSPPPQTWKRIRARAKLYRSWRLIRFGLSRSYQIAMVQLSKLDAFLSMEYTPWPQSEWAEWRRDPWFTRLLDVYGSMLKLAF